MAERRPDSRSATDALRVKGYRVSPELFTRGYAGENHPYKCNSKCCWNGAYVDIKERDIVLAHAEEIKAHMDETQPHDESLWFETEVLDDPDYPSGKCVGTAVANGGCVLRDKRGWCSIQVTSTAQGNHKWALKPLYCVLFPIEVIAGVIRFDKREQDHHSCCSVQPQFHTPLFQACRDELVHLLGEDGYQTLQDHYATHYPAPPLAATKKPGRLPVLD